MNIRFKEDKKIVRSEYLATGEQGGTRGYALYSAIQLKFIWEKFQGVPP